MLFAHHEPLSEREYLELSGWARSAQGQFAADLARQQLTALQLKAGQQAYDSIEAEGFLHSVRLTASEMLKWKHFLEVLGAFANADQTIRRVRIASDHATQQTTDGTVQTGTSRADIR